jgi:hypothetical protein
VRQLMAVSDHRPRGHSLAGFSPGGPSWGAARSR